MNSRLNRVVDWGSLAKQADYRAGKLAQMCRVSERQLERFFHDYSSTSPRTWIIDQKLEVGCSLLAEGYLIKEVAARTGYKNPTHFSRAFRRKFGCSPHSFAGPT